MTYIEREPLLEIAKELQGKPFGAPLIVRAIENAPTVDVVEVVRCKDCEHWDERGYDPIIEVRHGICEKPLGEYICHNIFTVENDYCSCGERRTN